MSDAPVNNGMLVGAIIMAVLSGLAVFLRFSIRAKSKTPLAADDWWALASLVFFYVTIGAEIWCKWHSSKNNPCLIVGSGGRITPKSCPVSRPREANSKGTLSEWSALFRLIELPRLCMRYLQCRVRRPPQPKSLSCASMSGFSRSSHSNASALSWRVSLLQPGLSG